MRKFFVIAIILFFAATSVFAADGKKDKNMEDLKKVAHILTPKTEESWMKMDLIVFSESLKNELRYMDTDPLWKNANETQKIRKKTLNDFFCLEAEKCLANFSEECYEPLAVAISILRFKKIIYYLK